MSESVGSKATEETYPDRGCTLGHTVAELSVKALELREMKPSSVPTRARFAVLR